MISKFKRFLISMEMAKETKQPKALLLRKARHQFKIA